MVISEIVGMFTQIAQLNIVLLLALLFIFVFVAYKLLKVLMKAMIFGVLGAVFPFFATYVGISIPLTITNIIWFALLGVMAYIMYAILMGGVKTLKLVTSPFRGMFKTKHKEKIIIREQVPVERKKRR
ncbi:MAG: hypothetical protein ABIF08_02290 [Nanoarchaeota archaeon]